MGDELSAPNGALALVRSLPHACPFRPSGRGDLLESYP
jgi:hypothetical protein